MKHLLLMFLFSITSLPLAAAELNHDDIIKKAEQALKPFKQGLMRTLQSEFQKNGLTGALSACHLEAPKIADSRIAELEGVKLGRATHRARNPENQPQDWMKDYFKSFRKEQERPSVEVLRIDESRIGYLEPIFISMPLCLQCHGTEIAPEVSEKIQKLYPDDQAINFEMGDFRGVFWVELELATKDQKD